MAETALHHPAQGLTTGIDSFAEALRRAGHAVYARDLYDGHIFDTLDAGMAYVRRIGFHTVLRRSLAAADSLDRPLMRRWTWWSGSSAGKRGEIPC